MNSARTITGVDVDEQVRADPPGQVRQARHGLRLAGEIDPDAALTPDDQVEPLVPQGRGQRFASRLTGARSPTSPG